MPSTLSRLLVLAMGCLVVTGTSCGAPKKTQTCTNACTTEGATQCATSGLETCTKQVDGCLDWSAPAACQTGFACIGTACVCQTPCGTTCCTTAGSACIAGMCCDDHPCGTVCGCDFPNVCVKDGTGSDTCAQGCSSSFECAQVSGSTPCCAVGSDPTQGGCIAQPPAADFICKCQSGTDCGDPSLSCAPDTAEKSGGQYVCAPVDGSPYGGCNGGTPCEADAGFDCWQDNAGNDFCTKSCATSSDCAVQGACCVMPPNATCSNVGGGQCAGAGACMPCSDVPDGGT